MLFDQVKLRRPKKSKFNLSHEKKMSMEMGKLTPFLFEEIVPGDKFKTNTEIFMRMAPMIAPIMHRVNVYTHYFFVPNRIIWDDWEDFITGGKEGTSTFSFPDILMNNTNKTYFYKKRLPDYLGLPIIDSTISTVTQNLGVSSLPFRAYLEIFNEYYRDPNLSDPIAYSKTSGRISDTDEIDRLTTLRNRAWEKDYLTSALPWSQRGPEVTIPTDITYAYPAKGYDSQGNAVPDQTVINNQLDGTFAGTVNALGMSIENIEDLGITINDLRNSTRLQEWLEKNARGGYRYVEQVLSHFGVRMPDSRIQRPEYIGGGRTPLTISEVLQTSQTTKDTVEQDPSVQGNMSGHGIAVGSGHGFNKTFSEHGHVIGIMSVLPRTAYQQGVEKTWLRNDKLDYFFPEFANLGEQEVLQGEVWVDFDNGVAADHQKTFGYQSRYAEYKFKNSQVAGDFRDTLDFWHMGRKFATEPLLNDTFTTADPTKRIFAVEDQTEDSLYCQVYNSVSAIRPMPYYGTPRL